MKKTIKSLSILLLILLCGACAGDYMDTKPSQTIAPDDLFADTDKAKMAINGMARLMVNQYSSGSGYGQNFNGEGTIKYLYGEYPGENFSRPTYASGSNRQVMVGDLLDNNADAFGGRYIWYYYYNIIGNTNEFLYRIDNTPGTDSELAYLKAQALVFRAYCYEQLVQFFCVRWADSENGSTLGNLRDGLVLRTEANLYDESLSLVSSGEIYKQIYRDLDEAIALFSSSKETRSNVWEPNINVAYAVYARAAVTRQDYSKAAEMAAKARDGFPLMSNGEYTGGFSTSNGEWIWGSYGGDDQTLHYYGFHSYMAYDANTSAIRSNPICISKILYDKIPETDIRKEMFLLPEDESYSKTDGRYPTSNAFAKQVLEDHSNMYSESGAYRVSAYHSFKFAYGTSGKRGIGFINHFRSSEMYLIEAEANYFLGKEADAQRLLNELTRDSKRDENYECKAVGDELLKEIKLYRAIELWGEGFDWLDKKRYKDPIIRVSFADGGNFHSTVAGTINVDHKNGWVYVTPLYESENNDGM